MFEKVLRAVLQEHLRDDLGGGSVVGHQGISGYDSQSLTVRDDVVVVAVFARYDNRLSISVFSGPE